MTSVVLHTLDTTTLPSSLSHLLAAAADERPLDEAIVGESKDECVTFSQLKEGAMRVAERLLWQLHQQQHQQHQQQQHPHDFSCIGILLSDSPLFMLAPCACSFARHPFCYLGAQSTLPVTVLTNTRQLSPSAHFLQILTCRFPA
jgi:acyl-CoA synthetase (AMP-forming)/AMP-acid ligase II